MFLLLLDLNYLINLFLKYSASSVSKELEFLSTAFTLPFKVNLNSFLSRLISDELILSSSANNSDEIRRKKYSNYI